MFDVAVDPSAIGGGIGSLTGGVADLFAAGNFGKAASVYGEDVQLSKESTALKEYAATHEALLGLGATATGYAGGNLKTAGSAVDVLGESAKLASLQKSQISIQGAIEANSYALAEANAKSQETSSIIGGVGGLIGGAAQIALGV